VEGVDENLIRRGRMHQRFSDDQAFLPVELDTERLDGVAALFQEPASATCNLLGEMAGFLQPRSSNTMGSFLRYRRHD